MKTLFLLLVSFVSGSFLNFFWQDERNNYMNLRNMDQTDPALWETKVHELHDMGVDCLVLTTVANEGKAVYPSTFMEWGYPAGRKSIIDAIMDTADELGMQVILGTGWARNQLDNLADPYVIETQRKIMEDLASIYGKRPSFFGWYLPVEGCFIPYLSSHAVEGANRLTERARELTPGAKVMISPYGLFKADYSNPKFAESIKQLKVDIIAHQDEVGCVRVPYPMPELKEHLEIVGKIHRECGIEFWVNVESFTWDRPANNWYSTLIPASFGRYLSQICAASRAGADKIISFALCGTMDKPGSPYQIGQPVLSGEFYNNYMAWKNGDRRWKLLESVLMEEDLGSYKVVGGPASLSDGKGAEEDPADKGWTRFEGGKMEVTLDLGKKTPLRSVAAHFCDSRKDGIVIPQSFEVLVSDNGKTFSHVTTVAYSGWPNNLHDCWTDIILADQLGDIPDTKTSGRYVKVRATAASGTGTAKSPDILCSEIIINQ